MAAEIINLRQARKRKARADKDRTAEQNRIEHGRAKSERLLTDARNALETRRFDQKKRDTPAGAPRDDMSD